MGSLSVRHFGSNTIDKQGASLQRTETIDRFISPTDMTIHPLSLHSFFALGKPAWDCGNRIQCQGARDSRAALTGRSRIVISPRQAGPRLLISDPVWPSRRTNSGPIDPRPTLSSFGDPRASRMATPPAFGLRLQGSIAGFLDSESALAVFSSRDRMSDGRALEDGGVLCRYVFHAHGDKWRVLTSRSVLSSTHNPPRPVLFFRQASFLPTLDPPPPLSFPYACSHHLPFLHPCQPARSRSPPPSRPQRRPHRRPIVPQRSLGKPNLVQC